MVLSISNEVNKTTGTPDCADRFYAWYHVFYCLYLLHINKRRWTKLRKQLVPAMGQAHCTLTRTISLLTMKMGRHIISYHIIKYHIIYHISYRIYHITYISYIISHIISYIISSRIISLSYITSYYIIHHIISYIIRHTSYIIYLLSFILSCLISYHIRHFGIDLRSWYGSKTCKNKIPCFKICLYFCRI